MMGLAQIPLTMPLEVLQNTGPYIELKTSVKSLRPFLITVLSANVRTVLKRFTGDL
jgi:hypothetical protein